MKRSTNSWISCDPFDKIQWCDDSSAFVCGRFLCFCQNILWSFHLVCVARAHSLPCVCVAFDSILCQSCSSHRSFTYSHLFSSFNISLVLRLWRVFVVCRSKKNEKKKMSSLASSARSPICELCNVRLPVNENNDNPNECLNASNNSEHMLYRPVHTTDYIIIFIIACHFTLALRRWFALSALVRCHLRAFIFNM